jgi:Fe-S oxidoreductase
MSTLEEHISRAKQLFESGQVAMVIGYERGSNDDRRRVAFVRKADELDRLVLDGRCVENLANYLVREELLRSLDGRKIAIFLSPSGVRSVNVLAAEGQINVDCVIVLGFEATRPDDPQSPIETLDGEHADHYADSIQQLKARGFANDRATLIAKLEAMTSEERLAFWREQFSRCVKCYACRQVCPMCYCRRCIVDCNQPQWINTSSHELGNFEWNLVRAFHLAGRCVGCGNCERACPAGIPLMLLNQRLSQEVLREFNHFAGESTTQPPVLADFRKDDPETFIL